MATKASDVLKETMSLTTTEQPVNSIDDLDMGDMVMFQSGEEKGLQGQVRNIRNGKADVYVGSSLRAQIEPNRLTKMVKKSEK